MQYEVTAELRQTTVESFHIDLDANRFPTEEFQLKAAGKAELRTPADSDDKTFLLISTLDISAENQPELFHVTMVVNFFFETERKVEDYDEIVQGQCLPIIQQRQSEMANKVLEDIGYSGVMAMPEN